MVLDVWIRSLRRARRNTALRWHVGAAYSAMKIGRTLLAALIVASPACSVSSPFPGSMDSVAMQDANPRDIERALAWRSVYGAGAYATDQDQELLSLNPADARIPPVIWHVRERKVIPIATPPTSGGITGAATEAQIIELREFSGGLAAARVGLRRAIESAPPKTGHAETVQEAWGYVDAAGQWKIPPRFVSARRFVGGIAIVERRETPKGQVQPVLINRAGATIDWSPASDRYTPGSRGAGSITLTEVGSGVLVTQGRSWVDLGDGKLGPQSHVILGDKAIAVPGSVRSHDPAGTLWLIETKDGDRYWNPQRGMVTLPVSGGIPLTARVVGGSSNRAGAESAVYSTDGRLLADSLDYVAPFSEKLFIACHGAISISALLNHEPGVRRVGPDLPGMRCGLMDEDGKWWMNPEHQMIDRVDARRVRLQSGTRSCIVDIASPAPLSCDRAVKANDSGGDTRRVPWPVLDMREPARTPRAYGYQSATATFAIPPRLDNAEPFFGQSAVAMESGLPGLIDAKGAWLTPRVAGSPIEQAAQVVAVSHQIRSGLHYPAAKMEQGMGLIDRKGRWVIAPVFKNLAWYEDGSLYACTAASVFMSCLRIDTAGKLLEAAPTTLRFAGQAQKAPVPPRASSPNASTQYQPVAVSINDGKWGFQDAKGNWVIKPRFDDAHDFSDDHAAAALRQRRPSEEGQADTSVLLWGVIDLRGAWTVKPEFAEIREFMQGTAVARQGVRYGLIDSRGQWLHQPVFKEIGVFSNERATATREDGTACLLKLDGTCVGVAGMGNLQVGAAGDTYAVAQDNGKLFGFIDPKGQWVIPPAYVQAQPFHGDYAIVSASVPAPTGGQPFGVVVAVANLNTAGFAAVTFSRGGELRVGLTDGSGNWLLPRR